MKGLFTITTSFLLGLCIGGLIILAMIPFDKFEENCNCNQDLIIKTPIYANIDDLKVYELQDYKDYNLTFEELITKNLSYDIQEQKIYLNKKQGWCYHGL